MGSIGVHSFAEWLSKLWKSPTMKDSTVMRRNGLDKHYNHTEWSLKYGAEQGRQKQNNKFCINQLIKESTNGQFDRKNIYKSKGEEINEELIFWGYVSLYGQQWHCSLLKWLSKRISRSSRFLQWLNRKPLNKVNQTSNMSGNPVL